MVNSFQTGEEFALLQAAHARDHLLAGALDASTRFLDLDYTEAIDALIARLYKRGKRRVAGWGADQNRPRRY
jgi:DNA-binding LacI/PurR family transcriptional regulator